MEFSDLQYIALEGGGGKGAVYKGAIVALEKLFEESWRSGDLLKTKDGKFIKAEPTDVSSMPDVQPGPTVSILDYFNKQDATVRIKGISGSSAGSITAFPLSLGLTSTDIETILNSYPFSEEFLPNNELHAGKYRMVGMDKEGKAKILIAEDHLKKLGASKIAQYQFSAGAKVQIGSSFIKSTVRNLIVSEIVNIILVGLKDRLEPVRKFIEKIKTFLNNPNFVTSYPKNYLTSFFNFLNLLNDTQIDKLTNFLLSVGKGAILDLLKRVNIRPNKWKTFDLIPSNHMIPAVSNIIWDRGIYAGFEVRDFFYKILLIAISKDTHFRRGLLEGDLIADIASKEKIETLEIKFNDKFEVETEETSAEILNKLRILPERLTFKELNKITKINLTICVTNATTNQPIYFSHYFTPDFPVLEAIGASMNFPIAFKPTYNEANVLLNDANAQPYFVYFGESTNTDIYKEVFELTDYDYYLGKILKHVKNKKELQISTNGDLSFRSFLPYLRRIILDNDFAGKDTIAALGNADLARQLCYFFYNSAFKGLLIDGGVTNNLPSSIFTLSIDGLKIQDLDVKKTVLSLKVDNSFPPEIKNEARNILKNDKNGKGLLKEIEAGGGVIGEKIAQLAFSTLLFKKLRLKNAYARNADLIDLPKEVWIKIGKELIEEYRRTLRGFTPWNKQVNVIDGLMNSLQFGFDQGQIEDIADNENIISLYCYGVGTLDFDLASKDLKPLVKMAVEESEKSVMKYFGRPAVK